MVSQDLKMVAEQLRTEVEELENALDRILDALRDDELTDAERVQRAIAIANRVRDVIQC